MKTLSVSNAFLIFFFLAALSARNSDSSKCIKPAQDTDPCHMLDYNVYDTLDIEKARTQSQSVIAGHISAYEKFIEKSSGNKKSNQNRFQPEVCKKLISASVCNIFFPPCEGDGSQRYRKPCLGYDLAIQYGCGIRLAFGDLTFAYPPDCFEFPTEKNIAEEQNYADADMLGSWSPLQQQPIGLSNNVSQVKRGETLALLGKVLHDNGESEQAAHMLQLALRYLPSNDEIHTRHIALLLRSPDSTHRSHLMGI